MVAPQDILSVTHAIQQAVAPVFLLTGVSALLSVLTSRLGRVIDRTRVLDKMSEAERALCVHERAYLQRRARLAHWSISLCAAGALFICIVIAALFIGSELGWDPSGTISTLFIAAMLAIIAGLLCFMHEVALAMMPLRERSK